MGVSFEGYNESILTFAAQEDVAAGDLVVAAENGRVEKAAQGDIPAGLVRTVRAGYAGVQLFGYAQVAVSGLAGKGWKTLVCDGENGLKPAGGGETGRQYLVLELDTLSGRAGLLLG